MFSARHVNTPSSSKPTLNISNLSASILKRVWFSWVLLLKDHVILGAGNPDVEILNVRLPPSLTKTKGGGFFVNRGGAVGQTYFYSKQYHVVKFSVDEKDRYKKG